MSGKIQMKAEPMAHQRQAMRQAWPGKEFAFFHEMGLGKTFSTIYLAIARHQQGQINCAVVLCPNSIKGVWKDQIEEWATIPVDVEIMGPGTKLDTEHWFPRGGPRMKWLIASIESMSQGHAYPKLHGWMAIQQYSLLIVDESSRIKNYKATRTKRITLLGGEAEYRMILTGTSITQGIQDLYAQMNFLNAKILNMKSYFQFRNRYCIMGGFEGKQIKGYQNVDELLGKIAPYVHIAKKKDALDLPDKVYEVVRVELTAEQKQLIKELKDHHEVERNGDILTADIILERMTRFQQIIGGHFPFKDLDTNKYGVRRLESVPKLNAMLEMLRDDVDPDVSVIIWARFRPEIGLIADALRAEFGADTVAEFHGGVSDEDRELAKQDFQAKRKRFFVSNQATGGIGLTLTAATLVLYYSNTFSMEDRVQSEDRAHRKGQTNKVTYVDFEAEHKYDTMILAAVRHKRNLRDMVDDRMEEFKSHLGY